MMRFAYALLAISVGVPSIFGQDRHDLRPVAPNRGDRFVIKVKGDARMEIVSVVAREGAASERNCSTVRVGLALDVNSLTTESGPDRSKSVDTIEALACSGEVLITESEGKKLEKPIRKEADLFASLRGAELLVEVDGGAIRSIRDKNGRAKSEDVDAVRNYAYFPALSLVPDRTVAVGERWEISGDGLQKLLRPSSVRQGLRTAVTSTAGRIEVAFAKLDGDAAVLTLTGTAKIEYSVTQQGGGAPIAKARSSIKTDGSVLTIDVRRRILRRADLNLHYDIETEVEDRNLKTTTRILMDAKLETAIRPQ